VDTVCTYCGTGCQLTVQARNGEVLRVISKPDKGINNETLCARGRYGYSFIQSPERLVTPLVRKGGALEPATWDEALKAIKEGITGAVRNGGKIGGIASSRLSNEELYLFQRLMRGVLKTNHIDSGSRWNTGAVKTFAEVMELSRGGVSIYDALNTDTLLVIGSSISDENPVTDYMIRRLSKNKKMNIIIASPRGMKLDSSAALTLRHRPAAEGEIISGISRVLYDKNADQLNDLSGREQIKNISKESISSLTGTDWGRIESAADFMSSSKSVTLIVGNDVLRGPARLEFLDVLVRALRLLGKEVKLFPVFDRANQRGAWEMGVHPGIMPGYSFTDGNGLGCEGILEASSRGEMDALYVIGEDIVSDFPDGRFAEEALRRVKFLIVQDMFLTETAKMASVVLPGASFVEKDGTFTNQEGRVQRLRRFIQPQGDAKADWEIIAAVGAAIEPSFNYGSVAGIFEEIKEAAPMYRGIAFESLDGNGAIVKAADSSGGTDLKSVPPAASQTPPASPDPNYPFVLITGNHLYHSGRLSLRTDTLRDILSEAIVEISEEDAKDLRVGKGDKVAVKGERYEATLTVHVNKRSAKGVVFIPENFTDVRVNMFFTKGEGLPRVKVTPIAGKYHG